VRIDLNADLGEGFGDDDAMVQIVTSANVACGYHAGDAATMARVCAAAAARGVAVGAQVSYRDREGFGRRRIDVAPDVLHADVLDQIGVLDTHARAAGTRVTYVKAHGALYNVSADEAEQADALATAVEKFDGELALLGLPGSEHESAAARSRLRFVAEAYADRAYTVDGRLVPRSEPGAVLHDPGAIATRVVRLVRDGLVEAVDGASVRVAAESICVHGDTPGSVEIARAVRAALTASGVELAAFT
jgi:UPF0271 protein